jgi:hypothetical protein
MPAGLRTTRRLFGQEVALKRVDACNASHLVPHLQREAAVLSGACG